MSLLTTSKLTKYFGDTHAVDHVDFTVREGEVLALIGSNGAGKTTLVNLISGLLTADEGQILFRGQDVTKQPVKERIRAGIARSFQLVNLFDQLSALDNVALAIFSRQGKTRRLLSLADNDRPVWTEATEVLAPQLEPKVPCELPSTVAKPRRINRFTLITLVVKHSARDLGVVTPRSSVEVVGPDRRPDVVDHADLGVDVDGSPLRILDVIDADALSARIEQGPHRLLATDLARPLEDSTLVEIPGHDRDDAQLRVRSQGFCE